MMADGGADVRGGVEDVMPLQRLEEVEAGLSTLSSEFARIAAENVTANTKLRLLEENDHRHDENIKEIKSSTIKMEIQFSAIMAKFDSLESKIFSLLQQANKDSGAERKLWMDMIKYIVLIALGAAAGNQFLGK
jgi:predicted nuclease with TOPRIM domain